MMTTKLSSEPLLATTHNHQTQTPMPFPPDKPVRPSNAVAASRTKASSKKLKGVKKVSKKTKQ